MTVYGYFDRKRYQREKLVKGKAKANARAKHWRALGYYARASKAHPAGLTRAQYKEMKGEGYFVWIRKR